MQSVTKTGVNLTHSFQYAANNSGELEKVTYPYSGAIRWVYREFTYTGNRKLREVNQRYFQKVSGAAEVMHQFVYNDGADAGKSFHGYTNLTLPAATASRKWTFEETAGPYLGLVKQLDLGTNGAVNPMSRNKYTWSRDAKGGRI
jgi:hypothetical protein